MRILVCISNVPDTTTKVKFSNEGASFDENGVQWIINPWDELALTRAMELKEDASNPVSQVTVASVGTVAVEPTLRKAMAIGADDAIRVDVDSSDAYAVATQLASVVKAGSYDLILCGIESSDYNGAAVGGMLAEMLDLPSVSAVSALNLNGEEALITRDIDGGKEELTVAAPFVAVVQKGIAKEPRIAAMRGIMMARKKPLNVMPAVDAEALTESVSFALPEAKAPCKMIDETNVKELVDLLVNEAKVI
ncbi:MAG: electron transfer flavoprotein subunit alpha [Bacteroidetes bacterium]|nr:MAG: electron transfer flavoprotein subunit alpha [Bacteroidota bacterium]